MSKGKFTLPYTYRDYGSEAVVYDAKGKRVVGCPTEQEAIEFIKENQEEAE